MQTIQPSHTSLLSAADTHSRRAKSLAAAIASVALLTAGCGTSSPATAADVQRALTGTQ
jgi:hypothetical protein